MLAAALSGVVLFLLSVAATLGWEVTPRAILNWAGICGTLLALTSLGRSSATMGEAFVYSQSVRKFFLFLVLIFIAVNFSRTLSLGFLSDDFIQTQYANTMSWADLMNLFNHSTAGVFFRPLEYIFLRFVGLWAGFDPVRWHAVNLVLHLANCVLVFFIVSRLRIGFWTPAIATLLFGVHGSRPEAVAWANGRLGLLAGLLVLAALLMYIQYCERRRRAYLFGSLLFFSAALLTKESAYAFPLLLLLIAGFRKEPAFRIPKIHLLYWLPALIFFAYRWILLGGIGGYISQDSSSFQGLVLDAIKVLLWRIWAVLYFPINWSISVPSYLLISLAAYILALIWMSIATSGRRAAVLSLVFTALASLPALSLLLIGPSMEGSRLLYIPVLGFSIWLGVSIEGMRKNWIRIVIFLAIIGFHSIALAHNLASWQRISTLAEQVCMEAASSNHDSRSIVAVGLPRSIDGVLFLGNGFAECVQMYSKTSLDSIETISRTDQVPSEQDSVVLVWNKSKRQLERVR